MKTLYKHVVGTTVGTPRSGGKKGYETSVIGRQEREKARNMIFFHKLLRSVFFKAVYQQLQINNNNLT